MNKSVKSLHALLLVLCVVLSVALPVFAEETEEPAELTIHSIGEFLEFAENCRMDSFGRNLKVTLGVDINLQGTDFESIPIFGGSFDGAGHTVSGLTVTAEGSDLGLFRYLTAEAVVRDLTVRGEIAPEGSRNAIGGIAGRNAGTIENCAFVGEISGADSVGGIAGVNGVTGIIQGCRMEGELYGNHFVGGIAGENSGVIRDCVNTARINTTAQQNSVKLSDITLESMTNSEAVNTVTNIGGIAGNSSGVIRGCENRGDVGYRHMGYNIGGIAGSQSGYLLECENHGSILGRKEVGGIVGHMEPAALVEYDEDALQILQSQLNGMGATVNQTAANLQIASDTLNTQVAVLQDQVQDARDAVSVLIPDADNPQLPDPDAVLAAQNALSSSLTGMGNTLQGISSGAQNTMGALSRNIQSLQSQIGAMGATLGNVSDTLGGSIADVSDEDTEQDLTGKVESCINHGSILADLNVGGIAGAVAMENDLNVEDDWQIHGETSLNFVSELRAVILNCENRGTVTGKKQNAGGIIGWQSMGLVKACLNTGTLDSASADYVGGITGRSSGFIRGSSAKCQLFGSACVGGIAGSGTILSDCRSMVWLRQGSEKLGALLGEAAQTEEEAPLRNNVYLTVYGDLGGIDGVSYEGVAQPLAREEFLALEDLADCFRTVTIRFVAEDGSEETVSLLPGEKLEQTQIPMVPEKGDAMGVWEGIAETDLSAVDFDLTFRVVYTGRHKTIQSDAVRDNGLPVLLAEGSFTDGHTVTLRSGTGMPALSEKLELLEYWKVTVDADAVSKGRFLPPEESRELVLLLQNAQGNWVETAYVQDERYLVFSMDGGAQAIALAVRQKNMLLPVASGVAAAAVLTCIVFLILKKGRKKS